MGSRIVYETDRIVRNLILIGISLYVIQYTPYWPLGGGLGALAAYDVLKAPMIARYDDPYHQETKREWKLLPWHKRFLKWTLIWVPMWVGLMVFNLYYSTKFGFWPGLSLSVALTLLVCLVGNRLTKHFNATLSFETSGSATNRTIERHEQ